MVISSRIGFAVVGCGWAGRYAHLTPLRQRVDARLLWTIDRDHDLAALTAAEFGAQNAGTDLNAALADPDVHAVVVASPTALHAEHAIAALRAGKHVLVEKPMAASADEARMMAAAAVGTDRRVLMVAHCCRFMPAFVEAKRLIDDGVLGPLLQIQSRRNQLISDLKPWWNHERPGGFLLSWLGSHHVDLAVWLLGQVPPSRVYAEMTRNTPGLAGDDAFTVVLWFDNAQGEGTMAALQQSMRVRDTEHDFLVVGADATLRVRDYVHLTLDGVSVDLSVAYAPGEPKTSHASYARQLDEFIAAIRGGRPPMIGPEAGLMTMEVLDACYRSAENHTVQTVAAVGSTPTVWNQMRNTRRPHSYS